MKWSFLGLAATALLQILIVGITGSVALLADTIHNLGDALTAIPLWIAFRLGQWQPTRRFTYGYGRVEDVAGVVIVGIMLLSALITGYLSVERLLHPQPISYVGAVIAASLIGFVGNEAVAIFRIRVGKEIGSTALIADGYHARADGLTSLSVLFGAVGVWLGYALADPIVGLVITAVIVRIVWQSGKAVFTRLLDGIDPEVIDEITHAVHHTSGVCDVSEVRVRWLGHRLHAEVNVAVRADLSVEQGHDIAKEVRHNLLHELQYLSNATIHIDPATASGEVHHAIANHTHDEWPPHSH
ncbi:MAG: cation diffusion facilitator family transporter [Nitrospira sp.]|nr:cation diffusion facilitator family transporter [Nitrospira sp.]